MAITSTQMAYYLSGGSGNTNPNNSLGGGISNTVLNANDDNTPELQNLFSNRTSSQRSSGGKFHRCIFLKNTHSSLTATQITLWQSAINPASDQLFIAVGATGQYEKGDAVGPIANDATLPWISTTARFHAYLSASSSATLPDLGPSEYIAIWCQLKIPANAAPYSNDFYGLGLQFTTPG